MARLPSFQFYPGDWMSDVRLRRCSHAARGAWMDVLCVLHDSDEYGIVRWTLAELAKTVGCPVKLLDELVEKGVLRGGDSGLAQPYIYVPRSGRKDGEPQELVSITENPVWFSGRLVKDAYRRTHKGASTRFKGDTKPPQDSAPSQRHGECKSDGSSSSSSSSTSPISPSGRESGLGEVQIPANLDSPNGRDFVQRYAAVLKNQNKFDPVSFQTLLQHISVYAPRKAMGLLAEWILSRRWKPEFSVDWEQYAPPPESLAPKKSRFPENREPRIKVGT